MNFRRLMVVAGLLGLGLIVMANFGSYGRFQQAIGHVTWYVFILVGVTQLISYYCNARYYQSFFRISGYNVPVRKLYPVALAINFANQAIPSGGVAGATYIAEALISYVPSGKAALAQLFRYVFTFITFIAVLILGFMLLLFFGGNIAQVSVRVVLLLITVIILAGLLIIGFISDRTRVRALVDPLISLYNRAGKKVLRRKFKTMGSAQVTHFFDDFYSGLDELRHSGARAALPLLWALGGNFAEVITIYVVFVAFGHWVNPGVVIIAYTFANMASLAAVFTAGVGVYEATMIGTLTSLGVPIALAFSVVIVYRAINLGLFLPPGFYFYRKLLAES